MFISVLSFYAREIGASMVKFNVILLFPQAL